MGSGAGRFCHFLMQGMVENRPISPYPISMLTYDIREPRYVTLREDEAYTFSDYFRLGLSTRDVLRFHNYDFDRRYLNLPVAATDARAVQQLRTRIKTTLPRLVLDNEGARREFLIAPLILELVTMVDIEVRTEYGLNVSSTLCGVLNYWLDGRAKVVIAEAKLADLEKGFTQLSAEMVAVDQSGKVTQSHILGAVSIGDVWRFGVLDRAQKLLTQDLQLYTVPDDLEQILGILAAELQ